jgi:hypothetical protein
MRIIFVKYIPCVLNFLSLIKNCPPGTFTIALKCYFRVWSDFISYFFPPSKFPFYRLGLWSLEWNEYGLFREGLIRKEFSEGIRKRDALFNGWKSEPGPRVGSDPGHSGNWVLVRSGDDSVSGREVRSGNSIIRWLKCPLFNFSNYNPVVEQKSSPPLPISYNSAMMANWELHRNPSPPLTLV